MVLPFAHSLRMVEIARSGSVSVPPIASMKLPANNCQFAEHLDLHDGVALLIFQEGDFGEILRAGSSRSCSDPGSDRCDIIVRGISLGECEPRRSVPLARRAGNAVVSEDKETELDDCRKPATRTRHNQRRLGEVLALFAYRLFCRVISLSRQGTNFKCRYTGPAQLANWEHSTARASCQGAQPRIGIEIHTGSRVDLRSEGA